MTMKTKVCAIWAIFCVLAGVAHAQLLGVSPSYPQINFVNTSPAVTDYEPTNEAFSVTALPYNMVFSSIDTEGLSDGSLTIQIEVDTNGNLISGLDGFTVTGDVTNVTGSATNVYSGILLQGNVTAFGYSGSGGFTEAQFDFLVQVTGGQMASLFDCANTNELAITMTSESSTFTGEFTNAFSGEAKGLLGSYDTNAPTVICPPLTSVITTPATDPNNPTNEGFIVTYPDPVIVDSCDPTPIIFEDTPSGSFVSLSAGQSLTINVYGIDVSGNYGFCSFTVVMGATSSCSLAFAESPCAPVTLPTDLNKCYATYSVMLPVATNCTGQTFTATATAMNGTGGSITLTNLGNGVVQGEFPLTQSTNANTITYTATDGQGNSVVQQCQVFVKDEQPPTIMCQNQTATFKPIMTNALSCIEADFNNVCIAQSNYLWFSSVIQNTSGRNPKGAFTVHIFDQVIQLAVDNTNITLSVPESYVTFSNGVPCSTTVFTNGEWVTLANANARGNVFASGVAWQLPFNLDNVYWVLAGAGTPTTANASAGR